MRQPLIELVEKAYLKDTLPVFHVGDTVDVSCRIVEGDKERIQIFNGTVIARRGGGLNESFTVRRLVGNEGVERKFLIHSPNLVDVTIQRRGKVRRVKLYYLRHRIGKARKVRELRVSKKDTQAPNWLERWRNPAHRLGRRGERTAAQHLRRQRMRVLVRNFRCDAGEIDLICSDADTLVFVEVKTRTSDDVQPIEQSVHPTQWQRVQHAARYFAHRHRVGDRPCRFDLVTVLWRPSSEPIVEHIKDIQPGQ